MSNNIIDEAKRCLNCKNPRCVKACPVETNIPEMINLFLDGHIKKSGKMLFDNNPLSVICSLVCPHESQCEGSCILAIKGKAVNIGGIENYISDYNLDIIELKKEANNLGDVGIIGSGPAGITIAFILSMKGYNVTIFESHDKIGGVLRYGIPEFRLAKDVLERIKVRLEKLGVKIRPNTLIGPVITIEDLFRDGYDAIFIGTGVWNPRKLNIKGESLGNVHYAIDYLKNPEVYKLGNKVCVIGAGNVSMDVARTAIRTGSRDVAVLYRKGEDDIPASKYEVDYAKIDGVNFEFYKKPIEFTKDGVLYKNIIKKEIDGKITYIEEDEIKLYECDSIIVSVSQAPRSNIVSNSGGIDTNKYGFVTTDNCGRTTRKGIFASGDVVTGARTVVEAVKYSKDVANEIDKFIKGEKSTCDIL
ncbi:NAD(P)-dependent oxidoreductase [Helicovermis profundi]|uniref:NAD(P)-dependent oxidoreductase n=1 Tax=Helicovermis profundi TaxID=3065157 RepID=A0AAU9EEX3_9FIRM|nr:NAD(P)-dependent oxidoreductase [Clostridia bacterium S502]